MTDPRPAPSPVETPPPGTAIPAQPGTAIGTQPGTAGTQRADDVNYPAYSMGAAAELIGVDPAFLRALGRNGLIDPRRSDGGHRRYSRHEIGLAARAREVVSEGMPVAAACRIVALEYRLAQAEAALTLLRRGSGSL